MDPRQTKNKATFEGKTHQDLLLTPTEKERNSDKFQWDKTSTNNEAMRIYEDDITEGTESFLYFVQKQKSIEPQPHCSHQESYRESTGEDNGHILPQSTDYSCESGEVSHIQLRKREYKCSRCSFVTEFKYRVERHERTHTGEKPYTCLKCKKTFTAKTSLKTHELIHTREKPYTCSSCGKKFTTKASLQRHELSHTGNKPHKCSYCGFRFALKYNLRSHERTHAEEKLLFPCTVCPSKLVSEKGLRRHMIIHERKGEFICDRCPSSFVTKNSLRRHYMVHDIALVGDILSCVHCPFTCTRTTTLKDHMKIHVKDKPFLCFLCPSSFALEKDFWKHLGLHGISRSYKQLSCTRCSYKSISAYTFARHAKIHISD